MSEDFEDGYDGFPDDQFPIPVDPIDELAIIIDKIKAESYQRGYRKAGVSLDMLEMLAAAVPETVTKKQLIEMIKWYAVEARKKYDKGMIWTK